LLLRPKTSPDLWEDLRTQFGSVASQDITDPSAATRRLLGATLLVIDGINEHPVRERAPHDLAAVLRRVLPCGTKIIVTCRDLFWTTFDDDFKKECQGYAFEDTLTHRMGEFTDSGVLEAEREYFRAFRIEGELHATARTKCKFPLLLRFLCEAYQGRAIGPLYDIRLKDLFDEYLFRKSEAIARHVPGLSAPNLIAVLGDLALTVYTARAKRITFAELGSKQRLSSMLVTSPELYHRVLDEDVIIEVERSPTQGELLSFVYEEFMEYLCAKAFVTLAGIDCIGTRRTSDWLTSLLRDSYNDLRFTHIVEYMMAIARDDYQRPIWDEMYYAGSVWHSTMVGALAKIPGGELTERELDLLVTMSSYEGPSTCAEARRLAKEAVCERYGYYSDNERKRIWADVCRQWGDEQQAEFIKRNLPNLDATCWDILLALANDRYALGHEAIAGFDAVTVRELAERDLRSLRELLDRLKQSPLPRVRDWAARTMEGLAQG